MSHPAPAHPHAHAHAPAHPHAHLAASAPSQPHAQPHSHPHDASRLAPLLDLDASVLHGALFDSTNRVRASRAGTRTRRILDLGAGSGTGTIALAERFPAADVTALDLSTEMLNRVRSKAFARGIPGRVHTVRADLNDPVWPPLEPFDVIWASLSLHEVADPERVFTAAGRLLAAGGTLAVVEMDARPRVLPHDLGLGTPGLEARLHRAAEGSTHSGQPVADWTEMLARTGYTRVTRHRIDIAPASVRPETVARYARATIAHLRDALANGGGNGVTAEDRDTLGILLDDDDPRALLNRTDLTVAGTRSLWIAERP